MTEFVVDDERYMNVVPRQLRDVAMLVEPLTIAEKALEQIWQVQQRLPWACPIETRPGAGAATAPSCSAPDRSGCWARWRSPRAASTVYVYSREAAPNPKADLVESIGAQYVSAQDTSIEQLAEQVGNIDVVYEATGASSVSFEMLKVSAPTASSSSPVSPDARSRSKSTPT